MKFYIASKLENADNVRALSNILTSAGHEHTYDWTAHGSVKEESEQRLKEVCKLETDGVANADLCIVLLPGGRGTHVELGIALGRRIHVLLCAEDDHYFNTNDETCAFYWSEYNQPEQLVGTLYDVAARALEYGRSK